MTVAELIKQLQACPPDMNVRTWSDDEDDWIDVTGAWHEDGSTFVHFETDPNFKFEDLIVGEPEERGL